MQYTISTAFVLDVEPEELERREDDALHRDILQHVVNLGELMRARYPERRFRVILSDMIVSAPEYEVAPRGETAVEHGRD
jgi:hypothetical protein